MIHLQCIWCSFVSLQLIIKAYKVKAYTEVHKVDLFHLVHLVELSPFVHFVELSPLDFTFMLNIQVKLHNMFRSYYKELQSWWKKKIVGSSIFRAFCQILVSDVFNHILWLKKLSCYWHAKHWCMWRHMCDMQYNALYQHWKTLRKASVFITLIIKHKIPWIFYASV